MICQKKMNNFFRVVVVGVLFLVSVLLMQGNVFGDSEKREIIDEVDVSAYVLSGDQLASPVIRSIDPSSDPIFIREGQLQSFTANIDFRDPDFATGEVNYTVSSQEGSNTNRSGTMSGSGSINFYYRAPEVENSGLLEEEITITLSNGEEYDTENISVYVY